VLADPPFDRAACSQDTLPEGAVGIADSPHSVAIDTWIRSAIESGAVLDENSIERIRLNLDITAREYFTMQEECTQEPIKDQHIEEFSQYLDLLLTSDPAIFSIYALGNLRDYKFGYTDLLSKEDEVELATRMQLGRSAQLVAQQLANSDQFVPSQLEYAEKTGEKAKEHFVRSNVGLVYKIVQQFAGKGIETDDLVQEAFLGLLSAVEKFDPEKGFKFSTYAIPWISGALGRALEVKRNRTTLGERCVGGGRVSVVSLSGPLPVDPRDNRRRDLGDVLGDPFEVDPEIARQLNAEYIDRLFTILKGRMTEQKQNLLARDRKILSLHFGIGDGIPRSNTEIVEVLAAEGYPMTHQNVSLRISRILKLLRDLAEEIEKGFDD
jgi:RNA polymerase sigma factor (sigma-70 family)